MEAYPMPMFAKLTVQDVKKSIQWCKNVLQFAADDVDVYVKNAGADIIEGPVIRPWNARELVLKDPDGYVLTLSMRADHEKTFHDVIDEVTG
ncbi:hypothetical protein AXI59_08855 [Bacillus nakamurai]|uniref:VOC domain-containing protein n=1 Tax=Bacillus nakamurai TaxID=1793963 RepID=A0A150F387_9BACI|nr:hypothetical protein [Bacillus nakamurai]KXZ13209.1 hypothetical protein AXI58_05945 [Bacillus nakamurai]KXZ23476.1 hypothetical protein AXI59_08855 [Bacillus nakamurai]MED1227753.1 hypothetical protein [Bacillus nakamurai]